VGVLKQIGAFLVDQPVRELMLHAATFQIESSSL
jgi:hypothetical protein